MTVSRLSKPDLISNISQYQINKQLNHIKTLKKLHLSIDDVKFGLITGLIFKINW